MVNTLLDSITKQLGDRFGTSYNYYVEDVEQKLKRPCFTVDALNPLMRSTSSVRYKRTIPCVIHYFSDNSLTFKHDAHSIAEEILECLEYLNYNDCIIRGESMSYQLVDDVLEVFITYAFATEKVRLADEPMEDLDITNSNG